MHGSKLILGIDPGSRATGYGVVVSCAAGGDIAFVATGVIRTSAGSSLMSRLKKLYDGVDDVIAEFAPEVVAVEEVFVSRNVQSALKLGHARAAAVMAALNRGLQVYEYTPLEIKKAVVGYGRADKAQVKKMVSVLLNLSRVPAADAADALAVAMCHAQSDRLNSFMKLKVR